MAGSAAPYPLLLGDIGGTHLRFAVQRRRGGSIEDHRTLATADFATLLDAVMAWQEGGGGAIAGAAFAIAAPVVEGPIRLTNSAFVIDAQALARERALRSVWLMNDFTAQAWALPVLGPGDSRLLGSLAPSANGPMAILGPGTGLGVGGLLPATGGWVALSGEGGHASLAAADELEAAVIARARQRFGHVSAERLLSGSGLPLLYRCLAEVRGEPADPVCDTAAAISASPSDLAEATVGLFCAMLGGVAGSLALTLGARGGVWLAGGIAPKLADRLATSAFRERFEDKGRFRAYLSGIGSAIVTRPDPGLDGLAHAVERGGVSPVAG